MFRFLTLAVLLIGLMFTLTACGDKDSNSNESMTPQNSSQSDATEQAAVTEQEPTLPVHTPSSSSEEVVQTQTTAASSSNKWASLRGKDIDGNTFEFGDWLGNKPTVVNFWGTWCPPCRREIPDLVKLYKEYNPKGVEMVSIAVNDTPEKVRNYASRNDMGWKMLLITKELVQPFGLAGSVPTTIFYNASGEEVARFVGGRDYSTFKAAFEKALAAN